MSVPFSYYDLIETFPQPGCAVCALLQRDVGRHLDSLLYEFVTDPGAVGQFRASRGLCNAHGWQLIDRRGQALGVAVLYDHVLDEVLTLLERAVPDEDAPGRFARLFGRDGSGSALAGALEPARPCPACALRDNSEFMILDALSKGIGDARLREAYAASDGLCLPHFQKTLRATSHAEDARRIVTLQKAIWTRLKAELEEFMRKSDYHNAAEAMGAEGDSWQRIIARMTGERGVFGFRR